MFLKNNFPNITLNVILHELKQEWFCILNPNAYDKQATRTHHTNQYETNPDLPQSCIDDAILTLPQRWSSVKSVF